LQSVCEKRDVAKVSVSVALQEKKPMKTRKKKIRKKGGKYNSNSQVKKHKAKK